MKSGSDMSMKPDADKGLRLRVYGSLIEDFCVFLVGNSKRLCKFASEKYS